MNSKLKAVLLQIHLWMGVTLCAPLVLLGITGALLVFEHALRGAPHARIGPTQPIAAIIAAARKAAPEHMTPTLFVPPAEEGDVATVRFAAAGRGQQRGGGAQLFVDPVTLTATGETPAGFLRQVQMLHGSLLIPGRGGRSIVGWLGVVMLALGFSGLYLWWPRPNRWRAAFKFSAAARGVRLHRELHGAVGIWGLIVFIVVSFTGVDLAFPQTIASAVGLVLPGADVRPAPAPAVSPNEASIDVDQATALAIQSVADSELRSIGLPTGPNQPYRIGLARHGTGQGAPVITVFVDPGAAKVLEIRDPAAYSPGLRLIAWQHAIHSGAGLGLPWRILVGLSGLLPALFAVTGISMWLLKRRNGKRARAASLAMAE